MAAFSRVWSGTTEFWPPAWQAAQLALKIFSPAPASPAKAGVATRRAAPAAATLAALACADIWMDACTHNHKLV